jgi:hypothetical protein
VKKFFPAPCGEAFKIPAETAAYHKRISRRFRLAPNRGTEAIPLVLKSFFPVLP